MSLVTDKLQLPFAYYRIYSINRPGRLLNFWTLRVGAYSRWALIRGWTLIINTLIINFHHFQQVKYVYFATKQQKANNKTRRSNKARFLLKYSEENMACKADVITTTLRNRIHD